MTFPHPAPALALPLPHSFHPAQVVPANRIPSVELSESTPPSGTLSIPLVSPPSAHSFIPPFTFLIFLIVSFISLLILCSFVCFCFYCRLFSAFVFLHPFFNSLYLLPLNLFLTYPSFLSHLFIPFLFFILCSLCCFLIILSFFVSSSFFSPTFLFSFLPLSLVPSYSYFLTLFLLPVFPPSCVHLSVLLLLLLL